MSSRQNDSGMRPEVVVSNHSMQNVLTKTKSLKNDPYRLMPLSFPLTRIGLWDHRQLSKPITLHLTAFRNVSVIIEEKVLQLAQRFAQRCASDMYKCSFAASLSIPHTGDGLSVCIDTFHLPDTPRTSDRHLQPLIIPCIIKKNSAKPGPALEDYTCAIQTLVGLLHSPQPVSVANTVALHSYGGYHENAKSFLLHLDVTLLTCGVHFTAAPITPVPIVPTALSKNLMNGADGSAKTGYLTMNETRKLLLGLESDPKIKQLPIVGIWVSGVSLIKHPFVWASSLRYIFNTSLADRVCMPPDQFLIVLFKPMQSAPEFYDCVTVTGDQRMTFELSSCHEVVQLPKDTLVPVVSPVETELQLVLSGDKKEIFDTAMLQTRAIWDGSRPQDKSHDNSEESLPRSCGDDRLKLQPTSRPGICSEVPEVSILDTEGLKPQVPTPLPSARTPTLASAYRPYQPPTRTPPTAPPPPLGSTTQWPQPAAYPMYNVAYYSAGVAPYDPYRQPVASSTPAMPPPQFTPHYYMGYPPGFVDPSAVQLASGSLPRYVSPGGPGPWDGRFYPSPVLFSNMASPSQEPIQLSGKQPQKVPGLEESQEIGAQGAGGGPQGVGDGPQGMSGGPQGMGGGPQGMGGGPQVVGCGPQGVGRGGGDERRQLRRGPEEDKRPMQLIRNFELPTADATRRSAVDSVAAPSTTPVTGPAPDCTSLGRECVTGQPVARDLTLPGPATDPRRRWAVAGVTPPSTVAVNRPASNSTGRVGDPTNGQCLAAARKNPLEPLYFQGASGVRQRDGAAARSTTSPQLSSSPNLIKLAQYATRLTHPLKQSNDSGVLDQSNSHASSDSRSSSPSSDDEDSRLQADMARIRELREQMTCMSVRPPVKQCTIAIQSSLPSSPPRHQSNSVGVNTIAFPERYTESPQTVGSCETSTRGYSQPEQYRQQWLEEITENSVIPGNQQQWPQGTAAFSGMSEAGQQQPHWQMRQQQMQTEQQQTLREQPQMTMEQPHKQREQLQIMEQPQRFNEQPQRQREQPQIIMEQPQRFNEQPQILGQQPQMVMEQPQRHTEQPQRLQQQPQMIMEQPQRLNKQPQILQQQPQMIMEQPQRFNQQPQIPRQQPQRFNQQPQRPWGAITEDRKTQMIAPREAMGPCNMQQLKERLMVQVAAPVSQQPGQGQPSTAPPPSQQTPAADPPRRYLPPTPVTQSSTLPRGTAGQLTTQAGTLARLPTTAKSDEQIQEWLKGVDIKQGLSHYPQRLGEQPQWPMEQPQRQEQPQREMGQPQRPLEQPLWRMGQPQMQMEQPYRLREQPQMIMEQPQKQMEQPQRLREQPQRQGFPQPCDSIDATVGRTSYYTLDDMKLSTLPNSCANESHRISVRTSECPSFSPDRDYGRDGDEKDMSKSASSIHDADMTPVRDSRPQDVRHSLESPHIHLREKRSPLSVSRSHSVPDEQHNHAGFPMAFDLSAIAHQQLQGLWKGRVERQETAWRTEVEPSYIDTNLPIRSDESFFIPDPKFVAKVHYKSLHLKSDDTVIMPYEMKYLKDQQLNKVAHRRNFPDDDSTVCAPANYMSIASREYLKQHGLLRPESTPRRSDMEQVDQSADNNGQVFREDEIEQWMKLPLIR